MPLLDALRGVGVRTGDTLMIHASMRRVGCRAELLLRALCEAVGGEGRLLMLVCSPEDEPFDPEQSPAWAELGVLSEVFRTWPGVVLNEHPVARMGAWGRAAEELVGDPPLHDYYGPGSPLARLVHAHGKVLRLGADPDTTTLLHYAEYLANIEDKRRIVHEVHVRSGGRVRTLRVRCLDDEHGIRDSDGEDYFARILREALAAGLGARGPVGGADGVLLPARPLVELAADWMQRHLR